MSSLLGPPCEKCGKRSVRKRHRVYLKKEKGKPAYYCWACAGIAVGDGTAFTKHIVTLEKERKAAGPGVVVVNKGVVKS